MKLLRLALLLLCPFLVSLRAAAPFALALPFFACALLAGCAAPGDPTARHPVVPVAVIPLGHLPETLGPPRRQPLPEKAHLNRYGTPFPPT